MSINFNSMSRYLFFPSIQSSNSSLLNPRSKQPPSKLCSAKPCQFLLRSYKTSRYMCICDFFQPLPSPPRCFQYRQFDVYRQFKLDESTAKKESPPPPQPRFHVRLFCNTLNASDTSTHGGFSVLRRHADECLPPLDISKQHRTHEQEAKDLHGNKWCFKHIFLE